MRKLKIAKNFTLWPIHFMRSMQLGSNIKQAYPCMIHEKLCIFGHKMKKNLGFSIGNNVIWSMYKSQNKWIYLVIWSQNEASSKCQQNMVNTTGLPPVSSIWIPWLFRCTFPWLPLTSRQRSDGYRMKSRAKRGKILHLQPLGFLVQPGAELLISQD